ncbi:MAG TPA: extracellular solute-binding protein [Symbiobacteriaceae bacterium]|nr:extracellular solute-binding protein [Symbiobacteriaceae bacterium]
MFRKATAVLLGLAVFATVGCSSKPATPAPAAEEKKAEAPVTITFWHTYNADSNENKTLNEVVIPAFNKKYPNITVKSVIQPNDGLHDALVTAAAGGTTPDVMRMDIIWTPEFAKLGALEAVDAMPGFGDIKKAAFPGPLATNAYKGKYFGLPLDTNTQVMIYLNDSLKAAGMTEAPKSIEEFKKWYTANKGQKDKFAFALSGTYPWAYLPWFWSLGGKVTNDDYTKATGFLNSDASVAAVQLMLDMQKDGAFAQTHLGGQPGTWEGFKAGKYGAIQDGPWFFAIMGNELKGKMTAGTMPAGKAGSISVVGGENIVMFKNAKNKEAVWKFMQFMVSDEAQVAMAKTGQMPVTSTASASPVMKEAGYYDMYVKQLANAMPRTPVPAWSKIDDILGKAIESVMREKATPKAALDGAAKEIDALLN